MALMATTRRYSFRAVHSLQVGEHSEKIHGHQYHLEVSFYSCATADIDREVETRILNPLHGHDLTHLVAPATGEMLVNWIHDRLAESELNRHILGVTLQETRKNRFVSARSDVRMA